MYLNLVIKIYNILFIAILPLIIAKFYLKSCKLKGYRHRILERFGIFNLKFAATAPPVWIHAVSVGEIMAAIPIITQIKQLWPEVPIILTCTTPRGSEIVAQKLAKLVYHVYLPLDVSFALKNFLNRTKPKVLVLMEKEIWPNLIFYCNQYNISILMANAQLSNHSLAKYLMIKPLIAMLLSKINCICAQTKFDVYKFKQIMLSQAKSQVFLTGNTKFDAILPAQLPSNLIQDLNKSKPIWLAASTHPGEEEIILQAHAKILTQLPNTLLILVPRHPERTPQIIPHLLNYNLTFTTYSQQAILAKPHITHQVYLVDAIGQLHNLYNVAHATFIGGSLIAGIGGHNVLEAASAGIPIAVGPYTANWRKIILDLILKNGLSVVKDAASLTHIITTWLLNPHISLKIGSNAKNYFKQHTGATSIIIEKLLNLYFNT